MYIYIYIYIFPGHDGARRDPRGEGGRMRAGGRISKPPAHCTILCRGTVR